MPFVSRVNRRITGIVAATLINAGNQVIQAMEVKLKVSETSQILHIDPGNRCSQTHTLVFEELRVPGQKRNVAEMLVEMDCLLTLHRTARFPASPRSPGSSMALEEWLGRP